MREAGAGKDWQEMSVLLTDDAGIETLNRSYLGRPEVTDVLSFRYDPLPGEEGGPSAEVIVNVQRAVSEGVRRRNLPRQKGTWGPSHELALYLAHGCNHLTGLNDDSTAGRRRMKRREIAWVGQVEKDGLLEGLVEEEDAGSGNHR